MTERTTLHQDGGAEGFEGHFPNELSAAMQQRVNLALGAASTPGALMVKPFAALGRPDA